MEEKTAAPTPEQPHPPEDINQDAEVIDGEVIEGGIIRSDIEEKNFLPKLAEHLEKREKGLDMIHNFVIKRAYPGDFVSHDSETKPEDQRMANITNSGADRIARDVGIHETNRTTPEKFWHEKKAGHYYYRCEGDFSMMTFKGETTTIHAYGIASTMNPFYSKDKGQDKDPADIREDFIQRECIRDLRKQAVRELLGLRRIPVSKLKSLGFDISKIRYVSFGAKEGSQAAKNPGATADKSVKETAEITFSIKVLSPRTYGDTNILDVMTDKNEKYSWWGKAMASDEGKRLEDARKADSLVTVKYSTKGVYKNIESIVEITPK